MGRPPRDPYYKHSGKGPDKRPAWMRAIEAAHAANAAKKARGEPIGRPFGRGSNKHPRPDAAAGFAEPPAASMPARDETPKARPSAGTSRTELARQLVGARLLAAMFLGLPPLQVTQEEAKMEVDAIANALTAFGFDIETIGGKWIAAFGAVATLAAIEMPKLVQIAQWRAQQRAQANQPPRPDIPGQFGPAPGISPGPVTPSHEPMPPAPPGPSANGVLRDDINAPIVPDQPVGPGAPVFP